MAEKTLKDLLADGPTALAGLVSKAADLERQDQVLKAILPARIQPLVAHIATSDNLVILHAVNAERASRLRFLEPEILAAFDAGGFQYSDLKVQIRPTGTRGE